MVCCEELFFYLIYFKGVKSFVILGVVVINDLKYLENGEVEFDSVRKEIFIDLVNGGVRDLVLSWMEGFLGCIWFYLLRLFFWWIWYIRDELIRFFWKEFIWVIVILLREEYKWIICWEVIINVYYDFCLSWIFDFEDFLNVEVERCKVCWM